MFGISFSGWDFTAAVSYPYVILLDGILALIGALVALVSKIKSVNYLIPIGGLVAILGWIWTAADIGFGNLTSLSYGFWACLIDAVLALVGTLGVKK